MSETKPKWILRQHEHSVLLLYDDDTLGEIVVTTTEWPTIGEMNRLNEIVTACNAFGPLLEACKAIHKECDGICPPNIGIEIWEQLEAALAVAGVKE